MKVFVWRNQEDRLVFLLVVALLLSLVCFPQLWQSRLGGLDFPNVGWIGPLAERIHFCLYLGLMASLSGLLVSSGLRRELLGVSIGIWIFSSLLDTARFQPQFYLSFIWLGLLIFPTKKVCTSPSRSNDSVKFALVGFYFWAGVFKLNHGFVHDIFPWFMSGLGFPFLGLKEELAWIAASLEVACAILMLIPWSRKVAGLCLFLMHLMILKVFGPLGHSYHQALIIMNIFHILFLWVLIREPWPPLWQLLKVQSKFDFVAIILIWILPSLSLFNIHNDLLSFRIYSGSTIQANILSAKRLTKVSMDDPGFAKSGYRFATPVSLWSIDSLGYAFLSKDYFKSVFQIICDRQKKETPPPKLIINNSLRYPILGIELVTEERDDQVIDCE